MATTPISQSELSRKVDIAALRFIGAYIAKNGFSPSIREIGGHLDRKSPSAAQHITKRLLENGYIKKSGNHRSIVLTKSGRDLIRHENPRS